MWLFCVTAEKFPYLSKNDLKGKAELSLDEACHFGCCYFSLYISVLVKWTKNVAIENTD